MTEEVKQTIESTQEPFEITIPKNGEYKITPESHNGKLVFVMVADLVNKEITEEVQVSLEYDEIEETSETIVRKDLEIVKFTPEDKEQKDLNVCCDETGEYIFKVKGDSDVLLSGVYSLAGSDDSDDDDEEGEDANKAEEEEQKGKDDDTKEE